MHSITEHDNGLSITLCVTNSMGLHARPAAKLAQEAQKFEAEITLSADDQNVDAKSILDILSLAAAQGSELTLHGKGTDAREALEHLAGMFSAKFDEE